jgi:hypothetical protein
MLRARRDDAHRKTLRDNVGCGLRKDDSELSQGRMIKINFTPQRFLIYPAEDAWTQSTSDPHDRLAMTPVIAPARSEATNVA